MAEIDILSINNKKIQDVEARKDIQVIKENQINLIEDDTSMNGISDTVHDNLETANKTIIGGINEVNSQLKDIANLSLIKHTDGKVYIKKQDGTLLGNGIEIGGSDVDLSNYVQKETGKSLSTNDFNNEYKDKLASLKNYDDTSIKNDIQTQKARIDTFTSLKEGSTTGDAELIDGRIGDDGVTYGNIGNAIRTQFNNLKNYVHNDSILNELTFYDNVDSLNNDALESQPFGFVSKLPVGRYTKFTLYSTTENKSFKVGFASYKPSENQLEIKYIKEFTTTIGFNECELNYVINADDINDDLYTILIVLGTFKYHSYGTDSSKGVNLIDLKESNLANNLEVGKITTTTLSTIYVDMGFKLEYGTDNSEKVPVFNDIYNKLNNIETKMNNKETDFTGVITRHNFNVDVDYNIDNPTTTDVKYKDYGVIYLPKNYAKDGKKTRLIIFCQGTGERISENTNPINNHGWQYFLNKGYAVMDMNGMSSDWGTAKGFPVVNQHYCNKYLLQSYKKGYDYVMNKYPYLFKDVFVFGLSMGGGASLLLTQSGIIPVIAQANFCPAISVYKNNYMNPWGGANQQKTIAGQYNFDNWDTSSPSQEYFIQNLDKIVGYDNLMSNTFGTPDNKNLANNNYNNETEYNAYCSLAKYFPVPLKIWHCSDDTTVLYRYSEIFVKMIQNGGGIATLRNLGTGGHSGGWNNGSMTDTDIDGNSITTSIPFYEAIRFIQSFD